MGPDGKPTLTFSSDGCFARCCPQVFQSAKKLTMSVCCKCGEYICASTSGSLIRAVEQMHRCPGKLKYARCA